MIQTDNDKMEDEMELEVFAVVSEVSLEPTNEGPVLLIAIDGEAGTKGRLWLTLTPQSARALRTLGNALDAA